MQRTRRSAGRRVVLLTWRDSTHPEGGGSEKFVERVAEHLAARGDDVTICCAAYPDAPRDERRRGVYLRRRGGRLTVYLHGLAYLLGPTGRRADVVVDVQNGIPFFSTFARRRGVVVLVHHVHREQWQIIYPGLVGRVGWWIESRLAPRLYRGRPYITVSNASRSDLIQLGVAPADIEVVHNGIDVPHPDRLGTPASAPTICVLGRLVPHKQAEHALDVAAALRTSVPDLRVEFVGDGWWREHIEQRVAELGLADRVTLHGHLSDDDRDTVLDRSWLLLVPSVKEGWGINIMEAATRGVPALAYASAGGVTEAIVDGETGWIVDDLDGLQKRAEELLLDPTLRRWMGRNARARAARFTWDSTGEQFQDVLDRRLVD
ncbi:MAG TPA: glycosyltransferase family 4 protein [Jatrophihabitantaceae bacterium]|jgi:glycosyltransferase involved in cell wall biosynthesis|nr:glycosyltransferase family 4 protein [Jatrophihabitantaceae bacterium]